jgi:hypothetical protein
MIIADNADSHRLPQDQLRRECFGLAPEGLSRLGGINACETNGIGSTLVHDLDCISICDGYHLPRKLVVIGWERVPPVTAGVGGDVLPKSAVASTSDQVWAPGAGLTAMLELQQEVECVT